MPITDIRRVLSGVTDAQRQELFAHHRARLEARLEEVRALLDAVDKLTQKDDNDIKDDNDMNAPTELSSWLHLMPHLPVRNLDRSITYYEEALGFRLAWQTTDQKLTALASGPIESLLLVPWDGDGPPPPQSAYVYVENPDSLCSEFEEAAATIVEAVDSRPYGMRDFVVSDPDGHRFTLGRGEESLSEVADYYGLSTNEITNNPEWLKNRT